MTVSASVSIDKKKMAKLAKEAPRRADALCRVALREIARDALEQIQELAPSDDPDTEGYADELDVYQVAKKVSFAILHSGKNPPRKVADLDPATTVLDIRPASRSTKKTAFVFRALAHFGPFTVETWPPVVLKDDTFVVHRRVRADEVQRVKLKNQKDQDAIATVLRDNGIAYKKGETKVADVEAISDLQFQVIRKEFGLGVKANPHWRPALKRVHMKAVIKKLEKDKRLFRALLDADYRGWGILGTMKLKADADVKNDIEDFQKRIID